MKKSSLLKIMSLFIVGVLLLAACSSQQSSAPSGGSSKTETGQEAQGSEQAKAPVKLGVLIPKTGKAKDWGEKQEIAYKIAVEEINAAGGINGSMIELSMHDTGGKNEEAVTLTRQLIKENVAAIAGPYLSGECEVAFPIADKEGVPIISSSSAKPGLTAPYSWAFRNSIANDTLMDVAIPAFAKYYNIKNFAIIYDEVDSVSKSDGQTVLPNAIKKYGYTILNEGQDITFSTGTTDFSAIVTRLKGLNPEAIAFGGLYQEGLSFARELRRQGLDVPVIGTVGLFSAALLEEGGSDVEGWTAVSYFNAYSQEPRVVSFLEKFAPEAAKLTPNNVLPDPFIATAYDTTYVIAESLIKAGLDGNASVEEQREAIRKGWENLVDYTGITGTFSINQDGDADKQVYVMLVKDGVFQDITQQ